LTPICIKHANSLAVKCSYCGSGQIISDYRTGEVICSECGTVIEKIYYNGPTNTDEEIVVSPLSYEEIQKINRLKRYKYLKSKLNRPLLVMNTHNAHDFLTRGGKEWRLVIHKNSLAALDKLRQEGALKVAYQVVSERVRISSRTERVKVALSLYFLEVTQRGTGAKMEFLKELGIGKDYFRKLLSSIPLLEKIKIVEELRKALKGQGLLNDQ